MANDLEGPPVFHERQITPGQLEDMILGYLANLGADVELVSTTTGRVVPVTIDDVHKTYWLGERPDTGRPATPEEKARWKDFHGAPGMVTFYGKTDEGVVYEHLPAWDLALAPRLANGDFLYRWDPNPGFYLRWPEQVDA